MAPEPNDPPIRPSQRERRSNRRGGGRGRSQEPTGSSAAEKLAANAEEADTQPLSVQPRADEGPHLTPPDVRTARQGVDPDVTADPIDGRRGDSLLGLPTVSRDAASADMSAGSTSPGDADSGVDSSSDRIQKIVARDHRPYTPRPSNEVDSVVRDEFAVAERNPGSTKTFESSDLDPSSENVAPESELPTTPFSGERPTADRLGIGDEISTDASGVEGLPTEARHRGEFPALSPREPISPDEAGEQPTLIDHDAQVDIIRDMGTRMDAGLVNTSGTLRQSRESLRQRRLDDAAEEVDTEPIDTEDIPTAPNPVQPNMSQVRPTGETPPVQSTTEVSVPSVGITPDAGTPNADADAQDAMERFSVSGPDWMRVPAEQLEGTKTMVMGSRRALESTQATNNTLAKEVASNNPVITREAAKHGGFKKFFRRLGLPLLALGAVFLLKNDRAPQSPDQAPEPAPVADQELPETSPQSQEPLVTVAQRPTAFDVNGDGINEVPEPTGLHPDSQTGVGQVESAPEPVEPPLSSVQQAWQEIENNPALKVAAHVKSGDGFWRIAARLHQTAPDKFPPPADWMGKTITYTGPDGKQYQARAGKSFISRKGGYVFLDADKNIHMADKDGTILDPINNPNDVYFATTEPRPTGASGGTSTGSLGDSSQGSLGGASTPGGADLPLNSDDGAGATRLSKRGTGATGVNRNIDWNTTTGPGNNAPDSSPEPKQDEIQTAPLDRIAASDQWTSNPADMVTYLRDKMAIRLPSGLVDSDIIVRDGLSFSLHRKSNFEYDPNDVRVYPDGNQQPGFPLAGIPLTPEVAQKIGEQVKASTDGKVDYATLLTAIGYRSGNDNITAER